MNIEIIRSILKGDTSRLSCAFVWEGTPQGHFHWKDIFDGKSKLTAADKKYLRSLLPKKPKTYSAAASTQLGHIIAHMRSKGYITHRDAHVDYGVQAFTRRIADLRELGYSVVKEAARHPTTQALYYRYSLAA